ncbi:MAG: YlxR family protein [Synechococcus sp.]|nr:YlxR family protein [Synechococcus sp.]
MSSKPTLRRCVSCRQLFDRDQLLRVIRLPEGQGLSLEQGMGRSAYLCPEQKCFDEARKRRKLQRALRVPVADSVYDALATRLTPDARKALRQDKDCPSL